MGRIPPVDARTVVDLGCGTGDLTATLLGRWPAANVVGVDSSPEMIASAQNPGVTFELADLAVWAPAAPVDVLVSNAALQWVPDHPALVPRLAEQVAPGGVLAFQVPGNFGAPSHVLLREAASRHGVGHVPREAPVLEPSDYAVLLADRGWSVDAWETTYVHVLEGPDAVLRWVSGTALRPVLAALPDDAAREAFTADYGAALRAAYPEREWGTPFPFRRLFVVAQRPA